jgi:predicted HTH domain antitoxin
MQVTIEIPDAIAEQIERAGLSAARQLLEDFAVEEYRSERLSRGQVSALLGLNFWETEDFLQRHEAYLHFASEEIEQDSHTLRTLLSL